MSFKIANFVFLKNRLIWKQTVPGCDVSHYWLSVICYSKNIIAVNGLRVFSNWCTVLLMSYRGT